MLSQYTYLFNNILNPGTLVGAIVYALIVILVAWIVGLSFRTAIHRYLDKAEAKGGDSTSVRFLGKLGGVVVYVFALIFYTHLIPSLRSFDTTWFASVGIISVVIGLATQSTLSNLVAGVSLIIYHPFGVGDRMQVATPAGPEIGVVENIDLGYTSLRTPDGRRIVLPNSIMTNQTNINFSKNFSRVLLEVVITVADGSDIDHVYEILIKIAKTIKKITNINGCFITGLTEKGTIVMLSVMCLDPGDIAQIKSDLLKNSKKEFDAKGIKVIG